MKEAIGRNKDQRARRRSDPTPAAMQLLTQAKEAEATRGHTRGNAVLDEFTTYQVEGSVEDYLASDG